jgi:hypothetical protein
VRGFGPIDPTQQQRKLFVTQDDLALRITGLRPGETPFLQPRRLAKLSVGPGQLDCFELV